MDNQSLLFWLGVGTGLMVSVMANFLYDIAATSIGNRLIRHRISFSPGGNRYHVVFTDVCGIVSVANSKWGWFIKKGQLTLSVRLTFTSKDGQQKTTLANWKMDDDGYTTASVKLGSIREVILVTLVGNTVYPGSEVAATPMQPLQGDWDVSIDVIDSDTQFSYLSTKIEGIVTDGKLTISSER